DASGRVVIEELDTPSTRRQKSLKKKAEKRKSAASAGEAPSASGLVRIIEQGTTVGEPEGEMMIMSSPAPPPISAGGPSTPAPTSASAVAGPPSLSSYVPGASKQQGDSNEDMDSESELSELSELPSEVASSQRDGVVPDEEEEPAPKKTPLQAKRVRGKRRLMELYDSGTLVWAKADDILTQFKETRSRRKMKLYIVRFYDRGSTWAYLGREKLKMLGEDDKLDNDMISTPSINQRWKNPKVRAECRAAYRKAYGEMESKTDADADADGEPEEEGNATDT
ncbi:hypothetical protein EST38_g13567, partial [Candolleomyces aberdarensis]